MKTVWLIPSRFFYDKIFVVMSIPKLRPKISIEICLDKFQNANV